MPHSTLVRLFNQQFQESENTVLIGGALEPLYLPADAECTRHRIYFSHDYAASALHEIAHWTIAAPPRRLQVDYGYWYAPDGRDAQQQSLFEQVEVVPQAIEWLFSLAAGLHFRVSADNLAAATGASAQFKQAVWRQACDYLERGCLPPRAALFQQILLRHFGLYTELTSAQLDSNSI